MGRLTHRTSRGSTYFVTTKAWQSMSVFQVPRTAEVVISKILEYRDKGNYLLHEFVLMPNHLHLILTPADPVSLEKAVQLIKGGSSHEIHGIRGNKMEIWQSGFHESRVTDWTDYKKKADYVRFNPVAAKLVERSEDWTYGSASGKYQLDPIPQGLKPPVADSLNVGAKAPTPNGAKAQTTSLLTSELKLRPPMEQGSIAAQAPTPNRAQAQTTSLLTSELKLRPPMEQGSIGAKAPTPNGAKAQSTSAPSPELKLRPPAQKDTAGHEGTTPCSAAFKAAKS